MKHMFVAITAAGLFSLAAPTPAAAQGIGCEVILCLAGGFPGTIRSNPASKATTRSMIFPRIGSRASERNVPAVTGSTTSVMGAGVIASTATNAIQIPG